MKILVIYTGSASIKSSLFSMQNNEVLAGVTNSLMTIV